MRLAAIRGGGWQRAAVWMRAAGLVLLVLVFFAPLDAGWLLALGIPGMLLLAIGALVWLLKDEGSWLRGD